MDPIHAILYGVIEGVTEFLPISSTGHLMILTELLGNEHDDFMKSFEVMIQLGAILAIVALYPKRLLTDRATILRILAAFIPTAIIGLVAYDFIKQVLLHDVRIVFWALGIGGIAIILIERFTKSRSDTQTGTVATLPMSHAVLLGVLQCLAFIPGVSRSATTIFGGLFFGLSRKEAVEYSFFLAVPTMGAATGLDVLTYANTWTQSDLLVLTIGFISSFVVALVVVRWLADYVSTHDFTMFGMYRILVAILGLSLFIG
jgi:undecaprenyl-diphosphatase